MKAVEIGDELTVAIRIANIEQIVQRPRRVFASCQEIHFRAVRCGVDEITCFAMAFHRSNDSIVETSLLAAHRQAAAVKLQRSGLRLRGVGSARNRRIRMVHAQRQEYCDKAQYSKMQ